MANNQIKYNFDKGTKGKSRIIIVLLAIIILIIGAVLALWALKKQSQEKALTGVTVGTAPAIESIPGITQVSREYAGLLRQENLNQARIAAETGTAAVPTITQHSYIGTPTALIENPAATPPASGCTPEEINHARQTGVPISELIKQGCRVYDLRKGGFSASQLKGVKLTAQDLRVGGYTASELRDAGFTASDLNGAGFIPPDLKNAGYTALELKGAGYDAKTLKDAGYTLQNLRDAGFTVAGLRNAATVNELKAAGFTAGELKKGGFNALDLEQAKFSPKDMIVAGLTDAELKQVGVPLTKLKALRASAGEIGVQPNNCNVAELKNARDQAISAEAIKKSLDCTASAFKAAGYSVADLKLAGFSLKDLQDAGFKPTELKEAGFTAKQFAEAGFTPKQLSALDFAGSDLRVLGLNPAALVESGMTPAELRASGYSAEDLKTAFTPAQLKAAGFSANDLQRAGISIVELIKSGFTIKELHDAGVDAADLKEANVTAEDLKTAGYTADQLIKAGFAPREAAINPSAAVPTITPNLEVQAQPLTPVIPTPAQSAAAGAPTFGKGAVNTGLVEAVSGAPSKPGLTVTPGASEQTRAEQMMQALQKRQARQLSAQQQQDLMKQIESGMTTQANDLFNTWTPPPLQQYVRGELQTSEATQAGGVGVAGAAGAAGVNPSQAGAAAGGSVIKAGTVMFAVLDTGINSDEQSPILATIVQGPLKGGKLLGQFTRADKKVVLNFTTMGLPTLRNSISVNVVAIDPDTARTAVASDVDNHYMFRYGTLFASSFVSGLGQAISQSGSTVVQQPFGNATIQNPTTSALQQGIIGIGNVGTQFGSIAAQGFQRPPTVKVNAGSGIGILFMADLTVPSPQIAVTAEVGKASVDIYPTPPGACKMGVAGRTGCGP